MGIGGVGIVNGALEKVLVQARDVMMRFDLAAEVIAVKGKRASVLADLLHRLQRLQHATAFVQYVLPHSHFLARWLSLFATLSHRRRLVLARGHYIVLLMLSGGL